MPLDHADPLIRRAASHSCPCPVACCKPACGWSSLQRQGAGHVVTNQIDQSNRTAVVDSEQAGGHLSEPGRVALLWACVATVAVQTHVRSIPEPHYREQALALGGAAFRAHVRCDNISSVDLMRTNIPAKNIQPSSTAQCDSWSVVERLAEYCVYGISCLP